MNRGVTAGGINEEVSTVLEGTILNKKKLVRSLAIPELCLLQMATFVPGKAEEVPDEQSFLRNFELENQKKWLYEPPIDIVCQGILPGLEFVVEKYQRCHCVANDSLVRGEQLNVALIGDKVENPEVALLDPYGSEDFDCKICRMELSNVYFHCDGCEVLLNKDFNICQDCYSQKKFMIFEQMNPLNPKEQATVNHTGK
jgi:hypothetical protein